jgi:hypothetical protein
MKITLAFSSSAHQTSLQFALHHAVDEYERVYEEAQKQPKSTEEAATPELTLLYYQWEQWRVTVLILAAACVEAAANFYIGCKVDAKAVCRLGVGTILGQVDDRASPLHQVVCDAEEPAALPRLETLESAAERTPSHEGKHHEARKGDERKARRKLHGARRA